MGCPVCDADVVEFDRATVLEKHEGVYHQCTRCGLVANLEHPWLDEAYDLGIHDADTGLLRRARRDAALASAIFHAEGRSGQRMLDWAGGYGTFAQLMRERGIDCWHHDEYSTPVFARQFSDPGGPMGMVTAFEVFEHLADPRRELAEVAERTDLLLFTTETLPEPTPKVADWWYYWPQVGQHITLHTVESLRLLGEHLGYRLTTNQANWHLYHRGDLSLRTRLLLSQRVRETALAGRRVRRVVTRALR